MSKIVIFVVVLGLALIVRALLSARQDLRARSLAGSRSNRTPRETSPLSGTGV